MLWLVWRKPCLEHYQTGTLGSHTLQMQHLQPLTCQLAQLTLLQIHQHLDIWDLMQPVLNGLQAGHLVTTTHGDISIQVAKGVLI